MLKLSRTAGAMLTTALLATPVWAQEALDRTTGYSAASAAVNEVEANRAAVVDELIARWGGILPAEGRDESVAKVRARLLGMSADELVRLQAATRWEEVQPQVFGDLTTDLVFTPLAGCRLLDTRIATSAPWLGPVPPNTTIDFSVNDSLAPQGGSAVSCDPTGLGLSADPPALAIIITAISPTGPGNLRTYASGGTIPLASMLNYTPGTTISSGVITQSCTSCSTELAIRNQGGGSLHIAVDLVGFFHSPHRTAVDQQVVITSDPIAANATFTVTSPNCPAGYRLTGGGFAATFFGTDANIIGSRPNPFGGGANSATSWLCQGTNGATAQDWRCYAVCSRVPGR
jgi:hypothetical protein